MARPQAAIRTGDTARGANCDPAGSESTRAGAKPPIGGSGEQRART